MRVIYLLFWVSLFLGLAGSSTEAMGQTSSSKCILAPDSVTSHKVHIQVDSMPSFPGGIQQMMEFISKHIEYPKTSICFEGAVIVSLVVEPDGRLTNKEILRSLTQPVDQEALKVLDKMPLWIPGKCQGKAVPTRYVIPVRFSLK